MFIKELYLLTESKNWKEILQVSKTLSLSEKRKILWTWPTQYDIAQLTEIFRKLHISSVLSIGCGCGLLEWILRESIKISIFGLEVDRSWWISNYAVKSFIDLNFIDVDTPLNAEFLQSCCRTKNWEFTLLFCYFNNRKCFMQYLSLFKGCWVIVIGPPPNSNIHTDPSPSEEQFYVDEKVVWSLYYSLSLENGDIIAFYTNV